MRILCPTCKHVRNEPMTCMLHDNPDPKKYYCFCQGEVTDDEWKRELLKE